MNHKDNPHHPYNKHTKWTKEQLFQIVPNDIVRYFKKKAYGDADADVETMHPTFARLETLKFAKKAFSSFI